MGKKNNVVSVFHSYHFYSSYFTTEKQGTKTEKSLTYGVKQI